MERHDKEWFKQYARCCDCWRPLKEDPEPKINLVQTQYLVKWKYPQFGNVLQGTSGIAAAVLCSTCLKKTPTEIKYCIEFEGNGLLYHPIEGLEKRPDAI